MTEFKDMAELLKWFGEITPGGVGIWTIVGLVALAVVKQRPIMQKLIDAREGNLLKERAIEMRGMRRRIAELEAEQRVDRHSLANLEMCLDTLLAMIETNPAKAKEAAAKVLSMRHNMKLQQATEKAGIHEQRIERAAQDDIDNVGG